MKRPIDLTSDLSEDFIQQLVIYREIHPKEPQILTFMDGDKRTDIKITKIKDGRVFGKETITYDPKDISIEDVDMKDKKKK